ncbi:hypothetical protein SDC9_157958 [bioreactor metagenome]|uniref:Uncharacterized protein n=1 Tax=bioreactor metagenome TaxID=1076179 RepID=A0A645FE47_9ZZZZ
MGASLDEILGGLLVYSLPLTLNVHVGVENSCKRHVVYDPEHSVQSDIGGLLPSLDDYPPAGGIHCQNDLSGEGARNVCQPFRFLHGPGADDDPVRTGGQQLLYVLRAPYPSADLNGHSGFPGYLPDVIDIAVPAEGPVKIHQVQVFGSSLDPHLRHRGRVRKDDPLAAGLSAYQLYDLPVHHVYCRYDYQRQPSANSTKLERNLRPDEPLFSGWN